MHNNSSLPIWYRPRKLFILTIKWKRFPNLRQPRFSYYLSPERRQGEPCQFEILFREGYAYDCYPADNTESGELDTPSVCRRVSARRYSRQSTPLRRGKQVSLPERAEGQRSELEALEPDRYPDNRDAPEHPRRAPAEPGQQTAAYEPEYIPRQLIVFYLIIYIFYNHTTNIPSCR